MKKLIKEQKNSVLRLALGILLCIMITVNVFADENTPVSMDFKGADLRDVLRTLSQLAEVNLITHQSVQGEVTLSLKDVPFKEAIDLITLINDLEWKWVGNTLLIARPDDIEEKFAQKSMQTFRVQYAPLDKVKEVLENLLIDSKISLDLRTRSIMVMGGQTELSQAVEIISNLDVPIPQVTIDVKVEEISISALDQHGPLMGNYARLKFLVDSKGLVTDLSLELPSLIEALKKEGMAKTLANPGLTTLDGQVAKLLIGDKIPVEAEEEIDGKTKTVIKYMEAGIRLEFTPQVSNDGYITLLVKPQISSLGETLTKGYPLIRTREVETNVRIKDGETFVIGGLIREEERKSMEKVPILGDIPILNALFKHVDNSRQTTEVLIIITPRIIYPEAGVEVKESVLFIEETPTHSSSATER